MLRRRRSPLLLAAAAGAAALAASSAVSSPSDDGRGATSVLHAVARSSRAVYTVFTLLIVADSLFQIGFVVVDYKYSLRGLAPGSADYRDKRSEIHLSSAKKLLKLCEANKGFYVKAGQFVSSLRQVPREYSSTLSCLQDQATPCNFRDIKRVLEQKFGKDLHSIFLEFDEHPIAAASIAQVHRGRLSNNQEVAVKVQYPGLERRMKIDILTMSFLSKSVSWFFPDYRFEKLLSEFERTMSMELDFTQEAKNSERTASCFKKNNVVKVPHVFWELTSKEVLTMEFCSGYKVDSLDALRKADISPTEVAKALIELFGEMIFVHGFVHGDPHPGNILVSPQGQGRFSLGDLLHGSIHYIYIVRIKVKDEHLMICREADVLLDHGIYKELDRKFRLDYCQLWKALILLDSQKILELGEQFGVGKYAKYFPLIFTGRTIESKSILGTQMSIEEKMRLKQDLNSLGMDDISSFMESLPPDFLTILRTDGLLRSILGNLGAPHRVRLLTYAKCAIYGLEEQKKLQSELSGFLMQVNDLRLKVMNRFRLMLQKSS
uniref:ABC1 atypical kinase-like domain-containing protein n=1 Tax=Leersia perrieri TaxID=77586 RepID=A0A0D9XSZ8_9ORYZ